jgi:hypothetical protein
VATNATRPPDNGALPPAREGGCKVEPPRLTHRMIVPLMINKANQLASAL